MTGLDVLYWASLFLGGSYLVLSVALGGLSQLASQIHGAIGGDAGDTGHVGDTGHAGDIGHADAGADIGHADVGHADVGADIGHADIGHDLGHDLGADAGHDVGHDLGGHDGGSGDADGSHSHGDAHADHDVPPGLKLLTFLSPVLASGFLAGFGGAGVLARLAKLATIPSFAWAMAGGVVLYYIGWWVVHDVFGASQASSMTKRDELTGRTGLVMAPINGSRPGMIYYTIAGTRQSIPAICEEGLTIPVGARVYIRRVAGKNAVVSRVGGDDAPCAHVKGASDA